MVIESKISRSSLDPFDDQLRNAILTNLGFVADLEKLETIVMVQNVAPVAVNQKIVFKDTHFNVSKLIGKGAYGRVYKVKLAEKDITFAVKKEMPPNLWELYILLELQKRIPEHLMSAFMTPEYAIVGNNATLIFASFSPYGTLLDVVNNVFNRTGKNVDETVVFILAFQMLVIIEQLHRGDILHLDLKPDNFLVMKKLTKDSDDCILQLIDFGNAVDLRRFPSKQKFNGTVETDKFKCSEMKEGRPWVYQPDLYCL
ncbi:Mitotic checkpoint serine/threonine-protein kinase BUB1, partial [Pseudolycoriella hygida]